MRTHFRLAVPIMVVIAVAAMSPKDSLAETRLGIKTGASIASFDLDNAQPNISSRTGFAVALELEYSLAPSFRLFVEPAYAQKGATLDFPAPFDFADHTEKWDYIVVPVGVKALTQLGPVRPFARAGVAMGFLVNNEADLKNGPSVDNGVDIEKNDVTVEMGFGVEIPVNESVAFTVEGRYAPGLTDIAPAGIGEIKTQTWLVLGGVSFRL